MKKYCLLLVDGGIVVKKLPLEKSRYMIGRADDTDLILRSKEVSRHHASVYYENGSYIVEDLNSTNGIIVNGKKISKCNLNPGDEISIGEFTIVFDDGSAKLTYFEETEIGRRGSETAIIKDKFVSLREKIKDENLKVEFKDIEHAVRRSRKRLSSLANEDRLTGLYNRQYFDKIADKEFNEAEESNSPFSILFIDIDHFKKINDTYGHKTGDEALKVIARLIRASCRKSDLVARYGGEEIVVILPKTVCRNALKVSNDICNIITRQAKNLLGIKITVSIGVATFPDDGATLQEIIEKADKALYRAKRLGRNRVCVFNENRS